MRRIRGVDVHDQRDGAGGTGSPTAGRRALGLDLQALVGGDGQRRVAGNRHSHAPCDVAERNRAAARARPRREPR